MSGFGFLITFVQLLIVKPTSKKIIIPIVVVTTIAFAIMVAIDFSLELQLARHVALNPPKVIDNGKPKKKGRGNSGFKTGYMIIYGKKDHSIILEINLNLIGNCSQFSFHVFSCWVYLSCFQRP